MFTILLALAAPAPALSAPDWRDRELAAFALRAAGPAARPVLEPLRAAPDPEARARAADLLRPLDLAARDAAAARDWFGDREPPAAAVAALHDDPAARHRVAASAWRLGLLDADAAWALSEARGIDLVWQWFGGRAAHAVTAERLEAARNARHAAESRK